MRTRQELSNLEKKIVELSDELVQARAAIGFYVRSSIKGETYERELPAIDHRYNDAKAQYESVCRAFQIPAYGTYNED